MKNPTRKLKIKHWGDPELEKQFNEIKNDQIGRNTIVDYKPHTNFAEEIYQSQKTDKFFNRILIPTYIILAICAIILVIVNIW